MTTLCKKKDGFQRLFEPEADVKYRFASTEKPRRVYQTSINRHIILSSSTQKIPDKVFSTIVEHVSRWTIIYGSEDNLEDIPGPR